MQKVRSRQMECHVCYPTRERSKSVFIGFLWNKDILGTQMLPFDRNKVSFERSELKIEMEAQ